MPNNDQDQNGQNVRHRPVLVEEVLQYLQPNEGESYLDLTAGYGGHASKVINKTKQPQKAVLVDRDQEAVDALHRLFAGTDIQIIHKDFLGVSHGLADKGQQFNMILADLGISSPHIDDANRGFSVSSDGPLDMRMDSSQELSAEFAVNNWSEDKLFEVIRDYGEEPKAQAIARKIVADRPIRSSAQLAAIASSFWPGHSKIHPATRTFQALRIAVNNELAQLEDSLPLWMDLLAPGGRMVVISFHSLEDRLVKQFFADHAGNTYDAELIPLTKKPVTASPNELVSNPRARSAKLRASRKK